VPLIQPCQIYCACKVSLSAEPKETRRTLLRALCAAARGAHAVQGRLVGVVPGGGLQGFPTRHFVFRGELKILDLARHSGAEFNLAGRQAIEHGINLWVLKQSALLSTGPTLRTPPLKNS
jgi:hypothetical protein